MSNNVINKQCIERLVKDIKQLSKENISKMEFIINMTKLTFYKVMH